MQPIARTTDRGLLALILHEGEAPLLPLLNRYKPIGTAHERLLIELFTSGKGILE